MALVLLLHNPPVLNKAMNGPIKARDGLVSAAARSLGLEQGREWPCDGQRWHKEGQTWHRLKPTRKKEQKQGQTKHK
jgi:hypothetical protein